MFPDEVALKLFNARAYEIIMGMCLSIVNRAVKRLLVEGEWTEGGNWKWSQLFPFPQSVYGNAFGARFSSHGGGKDSGREGKTDREDIKRKQGKGSQKCRFHPFSLENNLLPVCPSLCCSPSGKLHKSLHLSILSI